MIGVVQNEQIKRRLTDLGLALDVVQGLQIANLATSVLGLGVTAASTAIVLRRLRAVDNSIRRIEEQISDLPNQWRELNLHEALTGVMTELERLSEVSVRKEARSTVEAAEYALDRAFGVLDSGTRQVASERSIDPDLLASLLAGLGLCAAAQVKALIWLDEMHAARARSQRIADKMEELAFVIPADLLVDRVSGARKTSLALADTAAELRRRAASMPSLVSHLVTHEVNGRAYIERIEAEEAAPLLFLPKEERAEAPA